MLRVVIDTGVFISALIRHNSVPGRAVDKATREAIILMSEDMFRELAEVAQRRKFMHYYDPEDVEEFLSDVLESIEYIPVTSVIRACADPDDDRVLELAVSGRADAILSSDADLLAMNPFRGIEILSPRDYLDRV